MHGKEFTWHRPVRMVLKMLLLWGRLWLLLWFSILAIAALWVQVPIYQWFIAFKSTRKLWFRELYHQIRKVLYILGFPPALFSSLVLWISCYSITCLTCRKVLQIAEQVQSIFHPWVKVASCSWGFYSVTDRRQGGGGCRSHYRQHLGNGSTRHRYVTSKYSWKEFVTWRRRDAMVTWRWWTIWCEQIHLIAGKKCWRSDDVTWWDDDVTWWDGDMMNSAKLPLVSMFLYEHASLLLLLASSLLFLLTLVSLLLSLLLYCITNYNYYYHYNYYLCHHHCYYN